MDTTLCRICYQTIEQVDIYYVLCTEYCPRHSTRLDPIYTQKGKQMPTDIHILHLHLFSSSAIRKTRSSCRKITNNRINGRSYNYEYVNMDLRSNRVLIQVVSQPATPDK